jgi:hypothetical protein
MDSDLKFRMLKTLEVLEKRITRHRLGEGPKAFDLASRSPWRYQTESHAQWMCGELRKIVEEGCSEDKYNRWVGWIQATLWINGLISIEEAMADIRDNYRAPEK